MAAFYTDAQGQVVKYNDTKQKLVLCMSNMPASFASVVKKAGTPNSIYFKTEEIEPNNTGKLDKNVFSKWLKQKVPNKNYNGILILDWEGQFFDTIWRGSPHTPEWDQAVANFTNAIKYAKSLRPKAQWGIYNIPPAIYWVKQSPVWKQRMDAVTPIIMQCDILMPTLYDIYPTGAVSYQDDTAFISQSLLKTLEIAQKYKKPVLPFVWHRYTDGYAPSAYKAIDTTEFLNQIKLMSSVSYKGKKINGVIWWQEDKYFMNIRAANVVTEIGKKSPDSYQNEIFNRYWKLLRTIFK